MKNKSLRPNVSVTIDGPTASGKTTLGKWLSHGLSCSFLDTGLTFRALSYAVSRQHLDPEDDWQKFVDHTPLVRGLGSADEDPGVTPEKVRFRGEDVTSEIFAPELEVHLSAIASNPAWRAHIRQFQADRIRHHARIVVVGRDTAVTLLPQATLHVVLTADHAIRRERRRAQYRYLPTRSIAVNQASPMDDEIREIVRSKTNSIVVDTTHLSPEKVAQAVWRQLEKAISWLS